MADLFNVVFAGQIAGRADPATVRANVGRLFNASEAVLDKLFSGQPVALKKMVDQATAMQLRARMKQAGAEVRLVAVDAEGRQLAAASGGPAAAAAPVQPASPATASSAAPAPATTPAPTAAPATNAAAAPAAGDWAIRPVGSRLGDPAPPPPPPPDVSALTVAAPGGNLVRPEEIARPAPLRVDISGLSMAAAGSDVLKEEERRRVEPVQVDISALSMAEVGAPLDEIREDRPPLNPDISHLKLA